MREIKLLTEKYFKHKNVPEFNLSEEEYSRVLDSVVTANVDIIMHKPNGEVLLGMRTDKPLRDTFWIFGGRMKPGETIFETAVRHFKRELNIKANKNRFQISDVYNIMWPEREEKPQEYGFQTMMTILKYECTSEEAEKSTIGDDTHDNLGWYSRDELNKLKESDDLHPYLITVLEDAGLLD